MEDSNSVPVGVCKVTITGANKWSATLEFAGASKKRSAKGSFILAEGSPIAPITALFPAIAATSSISGVPAVTVNILIDGSTPTITGTYVGGTLRGFRIAKVGEMPPATVPYSMVLDAGEQDGITVPAGFGWMKGKVSNKGIGTFKGLLGDGTAASITLGLSAYGQAVLWSQPYKKKPPTSAASSRWAISGRQHPAKHRSPMTSGGPKLRMPQSSAIRTAFPAWPSLLAPAAGQHQPLDSTSRWTAPASATALGSALKWRNARTARVTIDGAKLSNENPQVTSASLPTEFTMDDKFNLVTSAPASTLLVAWKGNVVKADGGIVGTLTLPVGFSSDVPSGSATASGVLVQDEPWGSITGCGQIKVPVPAPGPKGSFRTSAILLDQ
jgi:hypothetical protein